MIRIIKKKLRIKITISKTRIYIDFVESYLIEYIIKGYKRFITFIDKYSNKANVEIYILKNKTIDFLIQNYRLLIAKKYRSLIYIQINNVKKFCYKERIKEYEHCYKFNIIITIKKQRE